jgi:LacI family gluconate utilization system Gnt-I transcriptional repressor
MEHVASLAGVSLVTVSRVIHEPDRVAEATRLKVLSAMEATGYVPNMVAGSLKSRRTKLIACVVPSVEHSISANIVYGVSQVLRPLGFHILLATSGFSPQEEEELVFAFLSRQPEAIMLTGLTHTPGTRKRLAAAAIPVIELANLSSPPIDMVVGYSNFDAGQQLTSAMIERGRRKFGYLLHGGHLENDRSRDRYEGYLQALADHGLRPGPTVEVEFGYAGGENGFLQLLDACADIDAICCSNDVIALGALYEAQRRGIAVPGRIGLAGFDDHDVSAHCVPSLTTVEIPKVRIGVEAGNLLRRTLAGEPVESGRIDVGFSLKMRETH